MIRSSYVLPPCKCVSYVTHAIDTYYIKYHSGVLIQIGTELLPNKNYIHLTLRVYLSFLKGALFVINLYIYQYKSTFSMISAVIETEIDNFNKFA